MSRRTPSLVARLAWRLAAIFLLAIAAAAGGVAWKGVRAIDSLRDQALQAQARDVERHLAVGVDGALRLDLPPALEVAYASSGGAYLYAVLDAEGRVVQASSPEAADLLADHLPGGPDPAFFRIEPAGAAGPVYGYVTRARGARIAVAQGRLHDDVLADSLVEEFLEVGLWWTVPVAVIALWVGTMTLRTSLAPLTRLSAQAGAIGPGTADVRLPEAGLPREVQPLVAAVNRALDRLKQAYEHQRRFTADAAHELRTPLAVLTARIDALDGPPVEGLRRDVDRMNRLVGQMLRVARLDAAPLDVTRPVDLRQVAVEAISAVAPLAVRERRELVLAGEPGPVWIDGDAPALAVALVNLLENALVHTSPGTGVRVELEWDGTLRVIDEGPGIPPDEREGVFRRFGRGRGTRGPGAGLGLAIVMETARAHGGTVEVGDRPGGGAVFTLRLGPARQVPTC